MDYSIPTIIMSLAYLSDGFHDQSHLEVLDIPSILIKQYMAVDNQYPGPCILAL